MVMTVKHLCAITIWRFGAIMYQNCTCQEGNVERILQTWTTYIIVRFLTTNTQYIFMYAPFPMLPYPSSFYYCDCPLSQQFPNIWHNKTYPQLVTFQRKGSIALKQHSYPAALFFNSKSVNGQHAACFKDFRLGWYGLLAWFKDLIWCLEAWFTTARFLC